MGLMTEYTPRQAAVDALELRQPKGLVPTFELEFQLTQEAFGRSYHGGNVLQEATGKKRDDLYHENADLHVQVADTYDWNIIMITTGPGEDGLRRTAHAIRDIVGDKYLLVAHGDATWSIPNGDTMVDFAESFFTREDEMNARADANVDGALERAPKVLNGALDGFALCADYCFNDGPFFSPPMFRKYVTPYLMRLVAGYREMGAYVIKHTDGDIMPILDQLIECNAHGLHSIDPQAGVDIAEVKRLYGDKVCLCGNVNCGLLQTGTDEEVTENAMYSLEHGMPGGGFIFTTSNVAFKGMPLERYELIMDLRRKHGRYA
jgi:uroporphyrinogen decarboxylase